MDTRLHLQMILNRLYRSWVLELQSIKDGETDPHYCVAVAINNPEEILEDLYKKGYPVWDVNYRFLWEAQGPEKRE